jgi:hypothetical protein
MSEVARKAAQAANAPVFRGIEDCLGKVESAVSRLSPEAQGVSSLPEAGDSATEQMVNENYVTGRELAEALGRVEKRLGENLDERFRTQALAIGSLRTMITDTDILLERVLERLDASAESTKSTVLTRGRAN